VKNCKCFSSCTRDWNSTLVLKYELILKYFTTWIEYQTCFITSICLFLDKLNETNFFTSDNRFHYDVSVTLKIWTQNSVIYSIFEIVQERSLTGVWKEKIQISVLSEMLIYSCCDIHGWIKIIYVQEFFADKWGMILCDLYTLKICCKLSELPTPMKVSKFLFSLKVSAYENSLLSRSSKNDKQSRPTHCVTFEHQLSRVHLCF